MPDSLRTRIVWGCLACLISIAVIYALTLAPTVQGFDSAELTVGAYTLGLVHPTGYPLYMLVGHGAAHIPWDSIGFRLNLLSAIIGTAAAGIFYLLLANQTRSALIAYTTAVLFAVAPHVWAQSIKAEVYTLQILLVVIILLIWFYAEHKNKPTLALLYFGILGLAIANHATSAIVGMALLLSVRWQDARWRNYSLAGMVIGASLAILLYCYFPWRAGEPDAINYIDEYFGRDPRRLADLIWLVSGQAFRCAVQPAWSLQEASAQLLRWGIFIWDGSLGLAPLVGIWGWKTLHATAPRWNRLLTIYFLGYLVFFLIYQVIDKETMFLPMYLIIDLWIAHGILGIARWLTGHLPRLNPTQSNLLINLVFLSLLGISILLDWRTMDLTQDRRAVDYATNVLQEIPSGTIIVNHWATASVFDYLRIVEGVRPDVRSFNLDFFSLGTQSTCEASAGEDAKTAWYEWFATQMEANTPLCFIEPLPSIPEAYQWHKQSLCWIAVSNP